MSYFQRRTVVQRLIQGPVGTELELFASVLREQKYPAATIRKYIRAADALGRWLNSIGVAIGECGEETIGRYICQLGRRPHPHWARGRLPDAVAGVRKFVSVLAHQHLLPPSARAATDVDKWLEAFDRHLDEVAGAAERTRSQYLDWCRRFMVQRFGGGEVTWGELHATDLIRFVGEQAQRLRPSGSRSGATFVTALRSLLRFLVSVGAVKPGLESAIPTVRRAKLAPLPRYLDPLDVARALATCDRRTAIGRRDFGVLKLLSRLGLRACEVVRLTLDDIDWRRGCLVVRPGKSPRERQLPLPADVGEALASYLKDGRPQSADRHVFLRATAPFTPLQPMVVTVIARTHLRLAGVKTSPLGAHVLRHTLATHLVRRGVPFKDVADVLGHARLETTAIYAKLDLDTLRRVALPWPGATR